MKSIYFKKTYPLNFPKGKFYTNMKKQYPLLFNKI